ncbi:recombination regulator RecX [Bacillus salitolerans]|uniref:Regulatory protein RecX n=1 Tax=Bacillus salitolerans TaxID=1437434 RepID=A0ABW4LWV9_9BACI
MAIITKILTQQKNKERYNIYIDDGTGEKYAFSVHQDVLIAEQLQKGKEIDEFDIEEIAFMDDVTKAFQKAIVFLSYRMRSTKEIMQHLKEKEIDEPVIQETIQKLKHHQYIDDQGFAEAYAVTNARVSLKGPIVLRDELIQKGISSEVIEHALSKIPYEDQIRYASKVAEKSYNKSTKLSEKMQKQKVTEALVRKGYGKEIINVVIEAMAPEKDEELEWEAICRAGSKAYKRYSKFDSYTFTQKMKQHLYQKGFPVELIEQYLESDELKQELSDMNF